MFFNSSLCLFVNGLSFHETVIFAGYLDTKQSNQTQNGPLSAQMSTVDAAFSSSPSLLCAANVIFSVGGGQYDFFGGERYLFFKEFRFSVQTQKR